MTDTTTHGIAVIGMAGRFPGAYDIETFWEMLSTGREGLTRFTKEALRAAGTPSEWLASPNHVPVGAIIEDADRFDAPFFDIGTRDAEVTDPQQRLFMACAWHALEHAGYAPGTTTARVGVYAGVGDDSYRQTVLAPYEAELLAALGAYRLMTVSGKDFIATQTAYKLNLTGPALTVQTACSTSLVAVHLACQALHGLECDIALAGGAAIGFPQVQGYLYQEGMILSPDGHCRAFDVAARGTSPGAGVGLVVLKRLDEALADGDSIHAVICGSAINNDGADKVGYTAPSVHGQADVIAEALAVAGVHPDAVTYIEAHGTATPLGDPIEIQALTQAFRLHTQRRGYCAIGSVKTNIGHADTAAGVAGLIKTVLSLAHRQLPPSLHFTTPNPELGLEISPFFVNTQLRAWETPVGQARFAGVSSFGIGGTNAHLVLTDAPVAEPTSPPGPVQLLCVSAKTTAALAGATTKLAAWLEQHPEAVLADVAHTLSRGRKHFAYRRALVACDVADAQRQLAAPMGLMDGQALEHTPEVVFLFPGQGSQYMAMSRGLYTADRTFREIMDDLATRLAGHLGLDIRTLLYGDDPSAPSRLTETRITQPVLFALEYALARHWMRWGITPTAMLGHSIGEYVAACLAGVFSLDAGLALVVARGALIQSLPPGAMLAVACCEAEARHWVGGEIALAAVNSHERCVVSGTPTAIGALAERLHAEGIATRRLATSHAFHSGMLDPILERFRARVRAIELTEPRIPYLSNLTGTWMRPQDACDPDYWVSQLRETVRFADDLGTVFTRSAPTLLEVGPGPGLASLARAHPNAPADLVTLGSLPRTQETTNEAELTEMLVSLGRLWTLGTKVDWKGVSGAERRRRIPLPLYQFERRRYWYAGQGNATEATDEISRSLPDQPRPEPALDRSLSSLEQTIAEIWSHSLGGPITADTDFFAAGGDSLLATQLMARLSEQFNHPLDAHLLMQAPTVAKLAAWIAVQTVRETSCPDHTQSELVVEIQGGEPGWRPLVLLHPVGGHVYFYRETAQHIDLRLPVYGIRAQGVHGEAEPLTSIAEMAEIYTDALRTLQSTGPYHLAGASFGGTLAYALAQRLVAAGEQVAYLGLIDTPSTANMPVELEDTVQILHYLLTIGHRFDVGIDTLRVLDEDARLAYFLTATGQVDTTAARAELGIVLKLFMTNMAAMRAYCPLTYPGKIHFYLARERDAFNAQTPAHGWIPLAEGGLEIHTVPGNHISMNSPPHVEHLGRLIRQHLPPSIRA
ncbi:phthiocerol/phenolphthiocerol synthesis type-I polyketide synthase E [Gammaproteobacteria bacterium]